MYTYRCFLFFCHVIFSFLELYPPSLWPVIKSVPRLAHRPVCVLMRGNTGYTNSVLQILKAEEVIFPASWRLFDLCRINRISIVTRVWQAGLLPVVFRSTQPEWEDTEGETRGKRGGMKSRISIIQLHHIVVRVKACG